MPRIIHSGGNTDTIHSSNCVQSTYVTAASLEKALKTYNSCYKGPQCDNICHPREPELGVPEGHLRGVADSEFNYSELDSHPMGSV
jgi:hypothetical protein